MKTNEDDMPKLSAKVLKIDEHSYFDSPITLSRSLKPDPFNNQGEDEEEDDEDHENIAIVQEDFTYIQEEDIEEYVEQDNGDQIEHIEDATEEIEDSDGGEELDEKELMKVSVNLNFLVIC